MSFWAGLARAYKDVDEKNEREDVAEAQEARYQSEVQRDQEWRTEDLAAAEAARLENIAFQRDQLALARERLEFDETRADADREFEAMKFEINTEITRAQIMQEQGNWEVAFDYSVTRDSVGDEQWQAEQDRVRLESAQAAEQWRQEFEFTRAESGLAADRWRAQFGFQQDRALTEDNWNEAMHLYALTRDTVSDEQWDAQFNYTVAESEAAEARFRATHQLAVDTALNDEERYLAEMEWRQERATVTDDQWEAGNALAVRAADREDEKVLTDRAIILMELGGGNLREGGSNPSVDQGTAGVQELRSELEKVGGLDSLSEPNQEFFNTMLGNPSAAAGVMAFVISQREDGNAFEITRLPQVIDIVGVTAARGEEAYNRFRENWASNPNNDHLADAGAFLDAAKALLGYEPSEVLWLQTKPVRSLQDQERMYDVWEMSVIQAANAELATLDRGSQEYDDLHEHLAATESTNSRVAMRGFNNLWDTHGRAQATALGLDNSNVRLKSFFANDGGVVASPPPVVEPTVEETTAVEPTVADPAVDTVVDPMVDPVVEEPTTDPYAAYPDIDRDFFFDTPEDAVAFMDTLPDDVKARIEFVVVDGVKWANNFYQPPVEEPTVADPMVEDPVVEPTVEPTVEPDAEPVDEATRQLNAVLEGEGIDPAEFQRFITKIDEVEGFQDMTDYESLITIFQRMKERGESFPEEDVAEPAPEVSATRPRMRPEAEVVEEAPVRVEPEVEVEVPAEAPTLPEGAESQVVEAGVDLNDFYQFLMDKGFTAGSSRRLPDVRSLITVFKRERG
tara:strand:+ start:3806 stop:6193 length:2388 start_codon:yes stop_codon:yes gene_type:complete